MRSIYLFLTSIFLVFAFQSAAAAQSIDLTEKFKKSFNETVEEVRNTENADRKRALLNDSFDRMITVIERIEARAQLSEEEKAQLKSYKNEITEKQDELNGSDGFDKISDKDLDDFSEYSQQYFQQAANTSTITIGVTTLLLIIIILLLL